MSFTIKRKRLIHCYDQSLINSQDEYTGFIIYKQKKLPIKNRNKILLNSSRLFLKNNQFPMITKNINKETLYDFLKIEFDLNSEDILDTCQVYSIPKLKIYIVYIKYNININYNSFDFCNMLEMYKISENNDLYENIINYNKDHIKKKYTPSNGIKLTFRLERLYKYMIGFIPIE